MKWPRTILLVLLFCFVGMPLLLPLIEALRELPQIGDGQELDRLVGLGANTLLLIGGTLLVALPTGTLVAVLLFRTRLPLRRFFLFLVLLSVFIPLPVLVSAWQAALGPGGVWPLVLWPFRPGQPWTEGLAPAIWVHAVAAVPWVVLIVGQSLLWSERELEEEALLAASPWRVIGRVTLLRCRAAILLAALWVAVQTAGEITVTDMFVVRTFAEEIYRIFSEADANAAAQVVLLSLPATFLFGLALGLAVVWLAKRIPPVRRLVRPALLFSLGRWRWPAFTLIALVVTVLAGVPVATLTWRAGLRGAPASWSSSTLIGGLFRVVVADGNRVTFGLLYAALTALLTTFLSLLTCWCLREPGWGRRGFALCVWSLLAACWAMPGPVIGLGLKRLCLLVAVVLPNSFFAEALYFGPSPLPMMWAWLIRCLPFAVVVLWPTFRLIPQEFCDATRLEGASPARRLWRLLVPLSLVSLMCCVLVAFAQALAEISASKLATTPGMDTFTLLVFDRMHYGVAQDVAALCLFLLLLLVLAGAEIAFRLRCAVITPHP